METFIKRIDTVFVEVSDLDRSMQWYLDVLGLTMRWKQGGYAAFTVGETSLTLVQSSEVNPDKHSPFNFFTSNIEGVYQFLVKKMLK